MKKTLISAGVVTLFFFTGIGDELQAQNRGTVLQGTRGYNSNSYNRQGAVLKKNRGYNSNSYNRQGTVLKGNRGYGSNRKNSINRSWNYQSNSQWQQNQYPSHYGQCRQPEIVPVDGQCPTTPIINPSECLQPEPTPPILPGTCYSQCIFTQFETQYKKVEVCSPCGEPIIEEETVDKSKEVVIAEAHQKLIVPQSICREQSIVVVPEHDECHIETPARYENRVIESECFHPEVIIEPPARTQHESFEDIYTEITRRQSSPLVPGTISVPQSAYDKLGTFKKQIYPYLKEQ